MTCGDDEDEIDYGPQISQLFADLDRAGLDRLHPIERDIADTLRTRPPRTWCRAVIRLLEGIVLKAQGDQAALDKLFRRR